MGCAYWYHKKYLEIHFCFFLYLNQHEWIFPFCDYHILYKDRDNKEAKKFISKLTEKLNLKKNAKILDAACGKGRHSIEIEKLGYKVTGIDLSKNSIKHAKQFENLNLKFKIHDISIPLGIKFNAVFNLFTSFGYFEKY